MRYAAAIPACTLLAGTAAGVCLRVPAWVWCVPLILGWLTLAAALHSRRPGASCTALCAAIIGFLGAGASLGALDAARARRPTLLSVLAAEGRDPTTCGESAAGDRLAGLDEPVRERGAAVGEDGGAARVGDADATRDAPRAIGLMRAEPRNAAGGGTTEACTIVIEVEGRLADDAAPGEFGVAFTLATTRLLRRGPPDEPFLPVDGSIRVSVGGTLAKEAMPAWRAGRLVRAAIAVRAPRPYRNFGLPDQRDRLALSGMTMFGAIKSAHLVELLARGNWWQERTADIRAWVRHAVLRHIGSTPAAAIVTAVLIGDRAALAAEDERRLQQAGTYHVIAISGGNIAILTTTLLALHRLLPLPPRVRIGLTTLFICLYALVIEASPSVTRAVMAAVAYLGARAADHELRSLNVLATVIALMLAISPLSIVDTGFWLTSGATLGILCHAAPLLERWRRPRESSSAQPTSARRHVVEGLLPRVLQRLMLATAALVVMTMAAEVVLLPIAAMAFSQVTFAGLFLNLLAIPLMSIVQLSGLAMLAASAIAEACAAMSGSAFPLPILLADHAGALARTAASSLLRSADLVQLAPWLSRRVAPPPLWLLAAYFLCWSGIWLAPLAARARARMMATRPASDPYLLHRTRVAMTIGWAVSLCLIVWSPSLPTLALPGISALAMPIAGVTACDPEPIPREWHGRPWLRLTMLDVGQGSAALLETSSGHALLIDAAGTASSSFDIGARVVSPALWALGLRRMTALAITHDDIDHVGGAGAVLRDFAPPIVLAAAPLSRLAQASGIRWRTLRAGESCTLAGATIEVLNPPALVTSSAAATSCDSGWISSALPPGEPRSTVRVRNDDSLVLAVRLGDATILLPGDIGPMVERRLAPRLSTAPLLILAAPHHGSASSSTPAFLDALAPRAVLISAGLGNRHGHPAPAMLARCRARGIELFRTDLDGAIQLVTDGRTARLRTCTGRAWRAVPHVVPRL